MTYVIKQWKSKKKLGLASFMVDAGSVKKFFETKHEAQLYINLLNEEANGDLAEAWGWTVEKLCKEFVLYSDKKLRDGLVSKSWHTDKLRCTKLLLSLQVNKKPVGAMLVRDLTDGMFELQLLPVLAQTRAKKTIENILGSWIALFDFSKSAGCRRSNPARGQKLANIAKKKTKFKCEKIQPSAIGKILNAMDSEWRLMMFFAICTGLRQGEQRALTWGDILWDENKVRVNKSVKHDSCIVAEPKTSKSVRNVDLAPDLKQELQQMYMRQGRPSIETLIWGVDGHLMDKKRYMRRMEVACKAAGVEPIRWHDLRHFFASNMLQEEELWTVSNMLGHESVDTTTRIYGHWIEDEKDQAERLARMANKFSRFAT